MNEHRHFRNQQNKMDQIKWANLIEMTIISTTVGKNPLMEYPSQSTKGSKMHYLGAISNNRMILVRFQGKPFNITVIQVYALTTNAEEAEVKWFYEDLQDLLELTPQKRCPFLYRGLDCKSRKLRATWSNRQIWPWSTKQSRSKANRVLPRGHTVHSQHPLQTTQEKTLHVGITRWSTPKSD